MSLPAAGHRLRALALFGAALLLMPAPGWADSCRAGAAALGQNWLGAWLSPPGYATGAFADQTLRMVISPRHDGNVLRVGISNRFGERPVSFSSSWVGRQFYEATLVPGSGCQLTFGGAAGVTLAAGEEVFSDPVRMPVRAFENLLISLHVRGPSGPATSHELAQQYSYVAPASAGDLAAAEAGDRFTARVESYHFVHALQVVSAGDRATAIVTFGDSITDGAVFTGGTALVKDPAAMNRNGRYPDFLKRRLQEAGLDRFSVLNAGIGGNRLLSDALPGFPGSGPSGLSRLDADVIAQAGASHVIILIGTNDLGMVPPATSDQVIAGLIEMTQRLQSVGLKVILGTQTPSYGFVKLGGHGSPWAIRYRNEINRWVCEEGPRIADGVVDFHAALRDPENPNRMRAEYDSGDFLHPNLAGLKAMAAAIDLSLFTTGAGGGCDAQTPRLEDSLNPAAPERFNPL